MNGLRIKRTVAEDLSFLPAHLLGYSSGLPCVPGAGLEGGGQASHVLGLAVAPLPAAAKDLVGRGLLLGDRLQVRHGALVTGLGCKGCNGQN